MLFVRGGSAALLGPLVRFAQAFRQVVMGLAAVLFVFLLTDAFGVARAQDEAVAAQGPPLNIAAFVSIERDQCFDDDYMKAVKRFTDIAIERINRRGGVHGRPIQLIPFEDDIDNAAPTVRQMKNVLNAEQMLAIIGIDEDSDAADQIFEKLPEDFKKSRIPFLSDITDSDLIEAHAPLVSMQSSRDKVIVPMMARFIAHMKFKAPAIIGMANGGISKRLLQGLEAVVGQNRFVAHHKLTPVKRTLNPSEIAAAIADIQAKGADLVVLDVPPDQTTALVKQIMSAGAAPSIFLTTSYDDLPDSVFETKYQNAIYALAWDRLPEVHNSRLRGLISEGRREDWIFAGLTENPGCKPDEDGPISGPYDYRNVDAISLGTRFADMVGLIAESARRAGRDATLEEQREAVRNALTTGFAPGQNAFKGLFQNWSFDPVTRSRARTPFILIKPHTLNGLQLAPVQFVRLRSGELRQIETLYIDLDMIRIRSINDNQKSFYAEFYLSKRASKATPLNEIEFTNAVLDPRTKDRQLITQTIHDGSPSEAYPPNMQIYKISGRFHYIPELSAYPFDFQKFSIDLQPKSSDSPFIIQPPPLELRNQRLTSEGWEPTAQYVGFASDFVPVVDAFTHQPSMFPFYRTSFTWLMKRETTDYFLRVVVPLAFILIVAYLSIFIPQTHLEAIVTIQVTALLSAVALYLSLPQLDTDSATISDKIFVFDYMMVSVMIVISILRINKHVSSRRWLNGLLSFMHIALVPGFVAWMAYWVYTASIDQRF